MQGHNSPKLFKIILFTNFDLSLVWGGNFCGHAFGGVGGTKSAMLMFCGIIKHLSFPTRQNHVFFHLFFFLLYFKRHGTSNYMLFTYIGGERHTPASAATPCSRSNGSRLVSGGVS